MQLNCIRMGASRALAHLRGHFYYISAKLIPDREVSYKIGN